MLQLSGQALLALSHSHGEEVFFMFPFSLLQSLPVPLVLSLTAPLRKVWLHLLCNHLLGCWREQAKPLTIFSRVHRPSSLLPSSSIIDCTLLAISSSLANLIGGLCLTQFCRYSPASSSEGSNHCPQTPSYSMSILNFRKYMPLHLLRNILGGFLCLETSFSYSDFSDRCSLDGTDLCSCSKCASWLHMKIQLVLCKVLLSWKR